MENVVIALLLPGIIFIIIYFVVGIIISNNVTPPLKAPKPFPMALVETVHFGAPESESAPCEIVFFTAPKYKQISPKMIFMKDHIEIRTPIHRYLNYDISYKEISSVKSGRLKPFMPLWGSIIIGIISLTTFVISITMPLVSIVGFVGLLMFVLMLREHTNSGFVFVSVDCPKGIVGFAVKQTPKFGLKEAQRLGDLITSLVGQYTQSQSGQTVIIN
jgi:hypothetical protein